MDKVKKSIRCEAVWNGRNLPTFRRIMLPPSSGLRMGQYTPLKHQQNCDRHIDKIRHKDNSKYVPVHAMMAYRGCRGVASLIL